MGQQDGHDVVTPATMQELALGLLQEGVLTQDQFDEISTKIEARERHS